ncbi:hypothetical protein LX36DRAFT_663366 [Colletotrichum falcatum]|nr:hypothetical protein LX36DRAFT_663366 [Colletotrichum falcatum]
MLWANNECGLGETVSVPWFALLTDHGRSSRHPSLDIVNGQGCCCPLCAIAPSSRMPDGPKRWVCKLYQETP